MICSARKVRQPNHPSSRSFAEADWSTSLGDRYSVLLFRQIHSIAEVWDRIVPSDNFFLQSPYFEFLEEYPPEGYKFGYLLFLHEEQPVGAAYCQWVQFRGGEHLDLSDSPAWKRWIANRTRVNLLICGNMMLTGRNGFAFLPEVEEEKEAELLENTLDALMRKYRSDVPRPSLWMVKDVPEEKHRFFEEKPQLTGFEIEPRMGIDLDPAWKSQDDYLEAMKSKYRVRARRAFKKMEGVERVSLGNSQLQFFQKELHELYLKVARNSGFNMVFLSPLYFEGLELHFPKGCQVRAYLKEGRIIGFLTLLRNYDELEAHFLGFEPEENYRHQLYLNMLYDIIAYGIEKRAKHINFARTALEIKSSVGANPESFYQYARHSCRLINRFLPQIFGAFVPRISWQPRHPFGK